MARIDICEPELLATAMEMARSERVKPADRLRAIGMVWDRANPVMTKHRVEVEHHLTNDERDIQHYRALKQIGAPQDAFLRRFGPNGLARVAALVLAEDTRQRQIEGQVIDARADEVEHVGA